VIDSMLACGIGLAIATAPTAVAAQKRQRMRRHPAPTFLFADLVGYSTLTEERGDEAAARVARDFRRMMCALSRDHGARQLKSMGDGVMIWAPDAGEAVTLAAHALKQVRARADLPPVRVGVHTGSAVMRGRDWYGSAVNVAARLASESEPNEALISDATRDAAHHVPTDARIQPRSVELRGVERPLSAWRLA
jgi:adenylate cyclase